MKQLLLCFLLLYGWPCLGQVIDFPGGGSDVPATLPYRCTEPVSRQQHYADSLLQDLDKSQIHD